MLAGGQLRGPTLPTLVLPRTIPTENGRDGFGLMRKPDWIMGPISQRATGRLILFSGWHRGTLGRSVENLATKSRSLDAMLEAAVTVLLLHSFLHEPKGARSQLHPIATSPQRVPHFDTGTGDICDCLLLSLQVSV